MHLNPKMDTLKFRSKSETLRSLKARITTATVKPLCIFTHREWIDNRDLVLDVVKSELSDPFLIVRSSAVSEDSYEQSQAGAYLSVANVPADDMEALSNAIEEVLNSFGPVNLENQFFVQGMLRDIKICGVLFTRTVDKLAPYYVANFDDSTGSHCSVTDGSSNQLKTYVRFRQSPHKVLSEDLETLFVSALEIEQLFGSDRLDIEFAITEQGELYILQVRPITRRNDPCTVDDDKFSLYLSKIYSKIEKLNRPHPGVLGKKAIYSVMTDWNPAEIVGIRPRRLALSLYKELVTDTIWAYQRNNYGYRNLRSFPLLISFMGCPYIDVRASFNSFVPAELDDELAEKLVCHYIDQLSNAPEDHDKVEFNIIYSCYYLNIIERIQELGESGFSDLEIDRIKFSLLNVTNKIFKGNETYLEDLKKIEQLKGRYNEIMNSHLSTIDRIYWLIEDCKRYGTLPFAGLARAGFIAIQFLNSFVDLQILSTEEKNQYMNSLNTVAKQLGTDFDGIKNGTLSQEKFLEQYGHLRPGTYDILSPRYDEAYSLYFESANAESNHAIEHFEFSDSQIEMINEQLRQNGLSVSAAELLHFMRVAIEGREYSKFIFTRNLSQVLLELEAYAARYGFGRDDVSHLDIKVVLDLYSTLTHHDVKEIFDDNLRRNRSEYELSESIKLPDVILDEQDVYDFFHGVATPNFVTSGRVTEFLVLEEDFPEADLQGKIVFIQSADPGYDWLFSRNIAGLITLFGGVNSHMAIRCAELQIPAVIGCGEQNFKEWSQGSVLELDCAGKNVRVVG